jgi:phytoene dehydrogenase-like protein
MRNRYDAVIVGSGPNGLAAAITLARTGRSVIVLEAKDTIGGGTRSAELTLPGFVHDVCSAVHPLAVGSPFFKTLPLDRFGLEWIYPPASLAHPFDDGTAVIVERSIEATSEALGADAAAYRRLMKPLVADWDKLAQEFLGPLRLPHHLIALARFGPLAVLPAASLAKIAFRGERARALLAGMACHSIMPLEQITTAAFGLMLNITAHAVGWPIPKGGSQSIANALAAYFTSLGGEIVTDCEVQCLDQLPPQNAPHRAVLLDVTPRQLDRIAGKRLPTSYRRKLQGYRYGPGVFKIDFALDGPIPWKAAECAQAATVHIGGTLEEIAMSERTVGRGQHPERPFVLVAQSSLFDPTRAPEGKHTVWAYCHVPNGSTVDMSERLIAQIDRFAPGFRDRILACASRTSIDMERYNPNYIGGDINGGVQDWRQLFTRPVARINPYTTPARNIYLCSSSTPPGGGVHGMCGYHAAQAVLQIAHQ